MSLPPGLPVLPPGHSLVDLRSTIGSVFIGSVVSIGLLGLATLQAWLYYNNFPNDPHWMKLLVVVVYIIEFLRSAFLAHSVYWYLVLNWGNVAGLEVIHWGLRTIVLITKLAELLAHMYFCWRIYMVGKGVARYVLTALTTILTLWNFAMGIVTHAIVMEGAATYSSFDYGVYGPLALATAVATDLAIAGSLTFILSSSRTGFSRTNRLINTLIFYAVQTGMVTVINDIVVIALEATHSKTGQAYVGGYAVVGTLYANVLMASLNARSALKHVDTTVMSTPESHVSGPISFAPRPVGGSSQAASYSRAISSIAPSSAFHFTTLEAAPTSSNIASGNKTTESVYDQA